MAVQAKLAGIATVAFGFLTTMATVGSADAATLSTLYTFCAQQNCTDGVTPLAGLVEDSAGDLYGTTAGGGSDGGGVAFELQRTEQAYTYQVIYNFCSQPKCADGSGPEAALVLDKAGNLYGTTADGGTYQNCGTVFELEKKKGWQLRTLYAFCGFTGDGRIPEAALAYAGEASGQPYNGRGPLYGTTWLGGSVGYGTAFQLKPKSKTAWSEKILHSFCSQGGTACTDGESLQAPLILDGSGNLYGTTFNGGGTGNRGNVFELSPAKKSQWTFTVLHTFCASCSDGNAPDGLTMDSSGNIIGATEFGGAQKVGTIFKLVPNGTNSQETVLYNFCSLAQCADGSNPVGVVIDSVGDMFGTTTNGGSGILQLGTVFELSGTALTVLYSFCSQQNCADGASPAAPPIMDSAGNLLGTTSGIHKTVQPSTVFELTP